MIPQILDLELERCGWKRASRHFDNAVAAALARDGETFDREIAQFRAISATWKSTRSAGSAEQAPASDK